MKADTAVAWCAFALSVGLAATQFVTWARGSEVKTIDPEQVLFYKSGGVLAVAVRLPMINTAADYNDMVLKASLSVPQTPFKFALNEIIVPIFNDEHMIKKEKAYCQPSMRCQAFSHMAISQKEGTVVTVPAGGVASEYYSFDLYCAQEQCNGFNDFNAALRSMQDKPAVLTIHIELYGDGNRDVSCKISGVDPQVLLKTNWQVIDCDKSAGAR